MSEIFRDFDLDGFWEESEYAKKSYVGEPLTDELVTTTEKELGYELPQSYIELMMHSNGGIPVRQNHRTKERTSWAEDHIAITGIFSIGGEKSFSLCGSLGSRFMIEEWRYPEIGVYFASCPSAGHDMLCLDYRECGPTGEPRVVHVDQGRDYKITFVAETFEAFVRGLEGNEAFETGD